MPAAAPGQQPPRISVIVPMYNVAGYVGPCLQSLKDQTFTDFEALVVDDGSTDSSRAEAEAAIGGDARFRILTQENGGLSAARNAGLAQAEGAFIAFLDADDCLAPTFLEQMLAALEADGGDWVACAIRYVTGPDGEGQPAAAIHGEPGLRRLWGPASYPLSDWREILGHFPSAWNKLYRRDFIGDLRFDEGTYFEDHAFFDRLAARSDCLLHLPEPLYLQTQGRAGQITRESSERVFDQFAALDTMRSVIEGSGLPGAREGLARIASRLMFERNQAIRDPDLRRRFLERASAWMEQAGVSYSDEWDRSIARNFRLSLAGRVPLTVIVPTDGQADPLRETLGSLARQSLAHIEVLIVHDGPEALRGEVLAAAALMPGASVLAGDGAGAPAARNRGLEVARGEFIVFLDAGDTMMPQALGAWTEALLRNEADMGLSRFRMGGVEGRIHNGLHESPHGDLPVGPVRLTPPDVLRLHAHPSAKIFRRSFLLAEGIRFGPEPLSSWGVTLRAAALAGTRGAGLVGLPGAGAVISTVPECRRFWRAPVPFAALRVAIDRLELSGKGFGFPPGWQARLLVRALWEKLNFAAFPDEAAAAAFVAEAEAYFQAHPMPRGVELDPYVGVRVRRIIGRAPAAEPPERDCEPEDNQAT